MEATAFCPAHVTGFFKAHLDDNQNNLENLGSMGAGFSIKQGVTTRVKIETRNDQKSKRKSNGSINGDSYERIKRKSIR